MGARKRRQEGPCWQEYQQGVALPPCQSISLSSSVVIDHPDLSSSTKPDKLASKEIWCRKNEGPITKQITNELGNKIPSKPEISGRWHPSLNISSFLNLFKYLPRKSLLSRNTNIKRNYSDFSHVTLVRLLIFLLIASSTIFVHPVDGVCVWQGGGGFKVACGFRQSGLFRIRSIGGIKGYVGAGFTIGDEDGFKDSLTNTETQPQQPGAYVIPNNGNEKKLTSESGCVVGKHMNFLLVPFIACTISNG